MAKVRHRTFEMYEFLQEADDALASKSARETKYSLDPDLWRFHRLDVVIKPSGVAHATFKQDSESMDRFEKDLVDLVDLLPNGSRVLMDFEGVNVFDNDAINKLTQFDKSLRSQGSRVVLCNIETEVRESFFPNKPSSPRG